jgi:8-oxo-dGTP diphosphatase
MIDVSCAIIRNDDEKILVVQRGQETDHPLKWEFPGGKVDPGEDPEDCIVREIKEELSLDVIIIGKLDSVEHDYGIKQVRLIPFICETLMDLPVLSEHAAYKWIETSDLDDIDFLEADISIARSYAGSNSMAKRESHIIDDGDIKDSDKEGIREMLSEKTGFGAIDLIADTAILKQSVLRILFDFSLGEDSTLAFRSAYTMQKAEEKKPGLLKDYYGKMVEALPLLNNESAIRSFLNIMIAAGVKDQTFSTQFQPSFNPVSTY